MTAPMFKTSLEPAHVTEGQGAKFVVEFDAEPAPAVKWFRYSFPVENSDDFKVINESNKLIRAVYLSSISLFNRFYSVSKMVLSTQLLNIALCNVLKT